MMSDSCAYTCLFTDFNGRRMCSACFSDGLTLMQYPIDCFIEMFGKKIFTISKSRRVWRSRAADVILCQ